MKYKKFILLGFCPRKRWKYSITMFHECLQEENIGVFSSLMKEKMKNAGVLELDLECFHWVGWGFSYLFRTAVC